MKFIITILFLLFLIGCGTTLTVYKKTIQYPDGRIETVLNASYWSTKDHTAPNFSLDKSGPDDYNIEVRSDESNASAPTKAALDGVSLIIEGLNKLKP